MLTCAKCGTEYAANLGPCFKCAGQKEALRPYDATDCSAMQNVMAGKLVAFDCLEKTLGFQMDEMPATAWLGQRVYLCLPNK